MAVFLAKRWPHGDQQSEFVLPGVRPVTLLIASGIILVTAILLVTGLAAGHLREEALATTQAELARINLVVAEAENRSFAVVDGILKNLGDTLEARAASAPASGWMAGKEVHDLLGDKLRDLAGAQEIGLIDPGGKLVNSSVGWPVSPSDYAATDYYAALKSAPAGSLFFGAPSPQAGSEPRLAVARRLSGPEGQFLGAIVASIPAAVLAKSFAGVPISDDAAISLLRRDGVILARCPIGEGLGQAIGGDIARNIPPPGEGNMIRDAGAAAGMWKIQSIRSLQDYPLAVLMTRGGDKALAGWTRQVLWFGGFALAGAIVVAAMVMLIARQFRVYAALAAVRAENIEMERARLAAEAELLKKERLSVLGQLTATVAHELRNPLSAIRNTLFSIKEIATAKGVKLDRPAARMERSIERCDRIIGDLLEYTKQRELRLGAVVFDHWLEEVAHEQSLAPGVALTTELHAPDAVISIDADRIRRVVINLIDNAVHAMTDPNLACPDKRITLRTARSNRMLELVVEDTGPGIAPENLSRLFEPLFSTKSFGTGLGLATVKQIVTQHDGAIRIESEPGSGTRVIVQLPLGQEAKAAA